MPLVFCLLVHNTMPGTIIVDWLLLPKGQVFCFLFFVFFPFFGCTLGMWKFPDQGLNPNCICDLCIKNLRCQILNTLCLTRD